MTKEQKALFDKLTTLQQDIALNSISGMSDIDAYKASCGKSIKENTMRASVCEILANPKVLGFIDAMKEVAVSDAVMSRQEMMERQTALARTSLNDLIEWAEIEEEDDEGNVSAQSRWRIKDSAMQDPTKMAAISELSSTKDGIKIKTLSPLAAMNQLADLAGYKSAEKHDHSSSDGSMSPVAPTELTDE